VHHPSAISPLGWEASTWPVALVQTIEAVTQFAILPWDSHPEAPRFLERGEGSGEQPHHSQEAKLHVYQCDASESSPTPPGAPGSRPFFGR